MIYTIEDFIHALEAVKKQAGNIAVRVAIQDKIVIEVDYSIEQFYNINKTAFINVLVIRGDKKP